MSNSTIHPMYKHRPENVGISFLKQICFWTIQKLHYIYIFVEQANSKHSQPSGLNHDLWKFGVISFTAATPKHVLCELCPSIWRLNPIKDGSEVRIYQVTRVNTT